MSKKKLYYLSEKEVEIFDWKNKAFVIGNNVYRKRVIGDGSCYFNAIVDAFFLPIRTGYINGFQFNRFEFIKKFRRDLARLLLTPRPKYGGKTYYQTLSRGELEKDQMSVPEVSVDNMIKNLLSGDSVGYLYHELISEVLNLDIYILDYTSEDVYIIDSDIEMYYKNRKSIVLVYIPGHFELAAVMRNGELKTYFDSNDNFIKKIKARLIQKIESVKAPQR